MSEKDFRQHDVSTVPSFANLNPFMRATYQEDPGGLESPWSECPLIWGFLFVSDPAVVQLKCGRCRV
jgi:hypothetical protein